MSPSDLSNDVSSSTGTESTIINDHVQKQDEQNHPILRTSSSHVFTNSVTTNLRKKKSQNFICLLFYKVECFDSDQTIEKNANVTVYVIKRISVSSEIT